MADDRSFANLLVRLQAGDQDAAQQVFHRFARRLIELARLHLDGRLRQKLDAEDVVQSVFKSFFLRHAGGCFDLRNWDNLWGLLVVITLRKCNREVKRFYGPEHDVRLESAPAAVGDHSSCDWEIMNREPTPVEAICLAEIVECCMRGLDDRQCKILELRLQGYTVPEISDQVGRTEFSVEGVLKRIRHRLRRLWEEEGKET